MSELREREKGLLSTWANRKYTTIIYYNLSCHPPLSHQHLTVFILLVTPPPPLPPLAPLALISSLQSHCIISYIYISPDTSYIPHIPHIHKLVRRGRRTTMRFPYFASSRQSDLSKPEGLLTNTSQEDLLSTALLDRTAFPDDVLHSSC